MSIARRLISIEAGQVRPFKFTIQVGANQLFELPLTAPGGKQPNITVTWGDGSATTTITSATSSDIGSLQYFNKVLSISLFANAAASTSPVFSNSLFPAHLKY